jgi:hypothetical protein
MVNKFKIMSHKENLLDWSGKKMVHCVTGALKLLLLRRADSLVGPIN